MDSIHFYMMLGTASMRVELTPEERNALNQFLRGNADLAD